MKNICLLFLFAMVVTVSACKKCYTCHNLCKVCYETHLANGGDTVLKIIVRSDLLGEKYYNEYIDSLTSPSLGWTCNDTASNYTEEFCGQSSFNNTKLINKRDGGLVCAESQ
ncbi:MAG TPA: hypothetical protein PLW44_05625 [Chitinophagales bacterium]|nr:hypothetical protein [Chitinophagales bacterium]